MAHGGWLRFLQAVAVPWGRATRAEARDYALWLARTRKPPRQRRRDGPVPGAVNPVTGKPHPAETYAIATRRHARAVIHAFYEYHRVQHGRPLINPFPAGRGAAGEQVNAHHNPMQPWRRPGGRRRISPRRPSVFRGRSLTSGSTRCLPRWPLIVIGPCWRSGSRPGPVPGNCSPSTLARITAVLRVCHRHGSATLHDRWRPPVEPCGKFVPSGQARGGVCGQR